MVYTVRERHEGQTVIATRGCTLGNKRSYKLGEEYVPAPIEPGGGTSDFTLGGVMVAYEEAVSGSTRDQFPPEKPTRSEWRVIVRNLRTGKVLHDVPTGTPLKPEPQYVGVGNVVALVVKSDGSAAWIADDYERSATSRGTAAPYFDVYALDSLGEQLLASGTDIDPSSLALSLGGTKIGMNSQSVAGNTLYWTQAGKVFSTTFD